VTISGNTIASVGSAGGGIQQTNGTLTITNSTISGNSVTAISGTGGGLNVAGGTATVTYSTITNNTALSGGGINRSAGTVTVRNSIVANQAVGGDCAGTVGSADWNLESATSCAFTQANDLQSTNPSLGALANNGGPTRTHLPAVNSAAVDRIPDATPGCGDAPTNVDQRGTTRPQGSGCDVGAVEVVLPPLFGTARRSDTSAPLSGIRVRLHAGNTVVAETFTGAGGLYTFPVVPAGTYKVSFVSTARQYFTEHWNEKATFATADLLTHDGSTPVGNINSTLAPASSVSGTVTDEVSGLPLAGRTVKIYRSNGTQLDKTFTDVDGNWTLDMLAPGTYFLETVGTTTHVGEYFNDQPTKALATPIVVPARVDIFGFDAQLTPADAIAGTLTGEVSGLPLAGATVKLLRDNGTQITKTTTGGGGTYSFAGLAPGTYRLVFSAPGHVTEYWDNKATLATSNQIVLTVPGGDVTANAALAGS
jgi:5-hydroxyisourate hydrolase-like protein (transthyretin family)